MAAPSKYYAGAAKCRLSVTLRPAIEYLARLSQAVINLAIRESPAAAQHRSIISGNPVRRAKFGGARAATRRCPSKCASARMARREPRPAGKYCARLIQRLGGV